jgi:carboxyl-terminal processing protease
MRAVESPRRPRVLALLLILVLAFGGGLAPPAAAQVATPTPATAPSRGADSTPTTQSNAPTLAEAYLLLMERYALPLDAAQLVDGGQAGMAAALKAVGVDVTPAAAGSYGTSTVEQFAVLQSQFQALAARYGDLITPRDLVYAAIRGMVDSVGDAHTNFLTPDEYQEQQRWERGDVRYGGIGARMRGPQATVVEVFPDTPAERAGLQPGDTIVGVDGQSATDLKLDEVIRLVRGTEGTPVVLRVQRAANGRVEDLTLVRAQVAAPFVSARRLPGNLGYVQLRGFPEASIISQVEQAILQQQREGVRGIVFDLRGNGGGRLGVGERLLSRFVPDGPIYQVVDRSGHRDVQSVSRGRPILTVPLAVLVDSGTASMGEVFAAAIEEHNVGRVIGTTTAGAVAASRFIPLSDGSALQISLEQVYSGAGAPLDRVGVKPDDEVELDLDALRQGRDSQLERATTYLLASAAAAATR